MLILRGEAYDDFSRMSSWMNGIVWDKSCMRLRGERNCSLYSLCITWAYLSLVLISCSSFFFGGSWREVVCEWYRKMKYCSVVLCMELWVSSETFFSIKPVFPFSSRCRKRVIERVLIDQSFSFTENIQHLCERNRSKTWGADGWKKGTFSSFSPSPFFLSFLPWLTSPLRLGLSVVVCIVSDGRAKINSRTLSVLAAMGVYQDGVAKNVVAGKPVTGHLYEYTTQVSVDPDLKMKSAERGIVPVQMWVNRSFFFPMRKGGGGRRWVVERADSQVFVFLDSCFLLKEKKYVFFQIPSLLHLSNPSLFPASHSSYYLSTLPCILSRLPHPLKLYRFDSLLLSFLLTLPPSLPRAVRRRSILTDGSSMRSVQSFNPTYVSS